MHATQLETSECCCDILFGSVNSEQGHFVSRITNQTYVSNLMWLRWSSAVLLQAEDLTVSNSGWEADVVLSEVSKLKDVLFANILPDIPHIPPSKLIAVLLVKPVFTLQTAITIQCVILRQGISHIKYFFNHQVTKYAQTKFTPNPNLSQTVTSQKKSVNITCDIDSNMACYLYATSWCHFGPLRSGEGVLLTQTLSYAKWQRFHSTPLNLTSV